MNSTGASLLHLALELGDKRGIRPIAGIGQQLDLDGAGNAPDVVPLGAGAHVDELRAGRVAPDLVRFLRRERAAVRQAHFLGALARSLAGRRRLPWLWVIAAMGAGCRSVYPAENKADFTGFARQNRFAP